MRQKALGPEFQKIEEMTRHLPTASTAIEVGIGDDTAVLKVPTGKLLFCSDLMIEDIHFKRDWASPQETAMKALTRSISDIAAMNGQPLYAVVSLAMPANVPANYHVELYKGFARAASEYGVEIVGGDLSQSPSSVVIDVSVVGQTDKPFTRKGAQPGDLVILTGELGGSAAGLHCLQQGLKDDTRWTLLRRLHLLPTARLDALKKLQVDGLVTSMIDISDSLSSELHHLAHHSKVGFEILSEAIPIHPSAKEYADRFSLDTLELALHGGEDHQLLFTVKAELWEKLSASQPETYDSHFHVIGVVTPIENGVVLLDKNDNTVQLSPKGWDHFS